MVVSNGNIYINNIEFNFYGKNVIGNKITYSKSVLQQDYFRHLFESE